jgi:predicted Zn-dependent protease
LPFDRRPGLLVFPVLYSVKTWALSIEDEWKMGQQFFLQVSSQYKLVSDPFACKYINDLGHYLLAPLETRPFPFHFYIIATTRSTHLPAPVGTFFSMPA